MSAITINPGVFAPGDLGGLDGFYREHGFAVLSGAVDPATMDRLEAECVSAQEGLVAGTLDARYGTSELVEGDAGDKARTFANYVTHITDLSPAARDIMHGEVVTGLIGRWLGATCWSATTERFGYVYQDARSGEKSSYTRIGWHSDWQSSPHLDLWPATAVTIHVDGTSPANGFLRVVPGSHLWATPPPYENVNGAVVPEGSAPWGGYGDAAPPLPMPLGFDKIPGEIALYADRGDILFHDCYLWHSAARATDSSARRRHVRGSWYAGSRPVNYGPEDFVKNAAR
ncbi:MAG: phytanoyl-CoA dioxygenase family protein [Actinomycetota bacterium]|nr:phytanoyl-CoA dioxygenase family protein [Actinomycetota bacterium]